MNKEEISLFEMLRVKRPSRSKAQREFLQKYMPEIPYYDAYGNGYLSIGKESTTAITCHVDTRHFNSGQQTINYDRASGLIRLSAEANIIERESALYHFYGPYPTSGIGGECLGADDTVGIWLAKQMISAKVPALYCFFLDEEVGGLGSSWSRSNFDWSDFQRCISLDRRNQTDVITHQMFLRTCSDKFAEALCSALSMNHKPCPHGSFTDSINFIDVIKECTNISVGYNDEHTDQETLDVNYLMCLKERLCQIKFNNLPTTRNKSKKGGTFRHEILS